MDEQDVVQGSADEAVEDAARWLERQSPLVRFGVLVGGGAAVKPVYEAVAAAGGWGDVEWGVLPGAVSFAVVSTLVLVAGAALSRWFTGGFGRK